MGIVNVDCEYIYDFITCKQDNSEITNFNLSVGFVKGYWEALVDARHRDEISALSCWCLKDYSTDTIVGSTNPVELFNTIKSYAYKNGEPGIIFLDVINEKHPIGEDVEATNPCGKMFAT